jgi:hypothetical protein
MANNLGHRASRNARYNLRGHAPTPIAFQTTAAQRRKDAAALRVERSWPITRPSLRSRGLQRQGVTCYLLSGLQALLHMPRFLNWLLSHNSPQPAPPNRFPCRRRLQVEQALYTGEKAPKKSNLPGCPACIVKQFAQNYWGNVNLTADGAPRTWRSNHPDLAAIRALDRALYILTPGASASGLQDPIEFQDRILAACLASTDYT